MQNKYICNKSKTKKNELAMERGKWEFSVIMVIDGEDVKERWFWDMLDNNFLVEQPFFFRAKKPFM